METVSSIINKLNQHGSPTLVNRTNVGIVGSGVGATEYGNAYQHTTILSINKTAALTFADNAALADGHLIYTLPAGAVIVNNAYMTMLVSNSEHNSETFEIGLGTTIGTGAVSALNGTAGFENILTGYSGTVGLVATGMDISNSTEGIGGLLIPAANAHTIHVNVAGTWANTAGAALNADIQGFVILNWTFLV